MPKHMNQSVVEKSQNDKLKAESKNKSESRWILKQVQNDKKKQLIRRRTDRF